MNKESISVSSRYLGLNAQGVAQLENSLKPATTPVLTSAFLLSYLAERASLAETAGIERLTRLSETPEVQRLFDAPSVLSPTITSMDQVTDRGLLELRAENIVRSGLFDDDYYAEQQSGSLPPQANTVEHYLTYGWLVGKDPHPLFSTRYYLARYPDVRASGIDPLTHYIERGSSEMRDPHPLFRNYYYASQHSERLSPQVTWLRHFLSQPTSHTSPHPIFDVGDYAVRSRTDPLSAAEALTHYLVSGWRNAVDASPLFRASYYWGQIGRNDLEYEPFTHYSIFGVPHAVNPHPLFEVKRYRSIVKDLDPEMDPLIHYVWKGERESISPSGLIDIDFYKKKYRHEIGDRGAFWHYLTEGARRDYLPNAYFDPAKYRASFMENRGNVSQQNPFRAFSAYGHFRLGR